MTAEALLRRQDSAGLAVVASALAAIGPDHHTPSQIDWIHAAVLDVFMVFSRDRDAAVRVCEGLARDPDAQVRCGADQLIAVLCRDQPDPPPSAGRLDISRSQSVKVA